MKLSIFGAHRNKMCQTYLSTPTQNKTFAPTTRWRLLSAEHVEAASRLVTALQQRPSLTGTASAVSRRVPPPFTCMDTNWGILVKATFWRAAIQKETSAKLHNFNPLGPLKGMGFVFLWRSYLFAGDYSHLHPSWQELIKEKSRGKGGVEPTKGSALIGCSQSSLSNAPLTR